MHVNPPREKFIEMARKYEVVPVYADVLADTETPISIYAKLSGQGPAFLLESADGGAQWGRYSFIGLDPFQQYSSRDSHGVVTESGGQTRVMPGPAASVLPCLNGLLRAAPAPELPRFWGGAVGYLGYGVVHGLEPVPRGKPDPLQLPDCLMMWPGTVVVFDHLRHTVKIIIAGPHRGKPEEHYKKSIKKINELAGCLQSPPGRTLEKIREGASVCRSNITGQGFKEIVNKAKEYILAGDIFQVVLSQRFSAPYRGDPFTLYRKLRSVNPSPYMFYLDFGDPVVVGASPEMLVRVEDGMVYTRPIAGTRPRGGDAAHDEALAAELLTDEKERAEHVMLVDLGRNDLGRVCVPGTVEVSRFMEVEKFSHVMHIVSDVRGRLAPGKTPLEALFSTFPAGTVSGAPKIRAMQIIEELEPEGRGIYAGAVGYIGYNGNLDTAIIIRTMVLTGGRAYIQAGAGIVADSDPASEYRETVNKAQVLLELLSGARGLDIGHQASDIGKQFGIG